MAIERDPNMPSAGSAMPPTDSTIYERDAMNTTGTNTVYDRDTTYARDTGGSNFWAFLIGGLVIAIGLLAFLFYDGGSTTGRDVNTTSSTTPRVEAPATPAAPKATTSPSSPSTPAAPSAQPRSTNQ
jgi:hypothetical protein